MIHLRRGGRYYRIADPSWADPLDGSYARDRGARWNPPNSFPVVYLNHSREVAKRNVDHLVFKGGSIAPEDLEPSEGPELVITTVPEEDFLDVVTDEGCKAVGLPETYPLDSHGKTIPHETCQPKGQDAWDSGDPGIACRTAAPGAVGEELVWFVRETTLAVHERVAFVDWYWGERWE